MKIHDKPIYKDTPETTHISQKNDGTYIIRITKNKKTYYYGSYHTIKEAKHIEHQLQKRNYPPRIQSTKHKKKRQNIQTNITRNTKTMTQRKKQTQNRIKIHKLQKHKKKKLQKRQKCHWCGKQYTTLKHQTKYCTDICRKKAEQENNRKRVQKHRQKHHPQIIGTGNLGQHIQQDTQLELKIIQKEKNRLHLR